MFAVFCEDADHANIMEITPVLFFTDLSHEKLAGCRIVSPPDIHPHDDVIGCIMYII